MNKKEAMGNERLFEMNKNITSGHLITKIEKATMRYQPYQKKSG
jgi:hypothetical protein